VLDEPDQARGAAVTTSTKSAPTTYSQSDGKALLIQSLPKLTTSVPRIAPNKLSRPPTATQITISIDGTTPNMAGEMSPMLKVTSAPEMPASAPAMANASTLNGSGL
jgi:hypothetical protein